jgi:calcineurin-like phosphoesterase family protein
MMSGLRQGFRNLFSRVLRGRKIMDGDEILDGSRVWFISDMHFGHRNLLKWSRGDSFRNLNEMHSRLIHNWNRAVTRDDRVFCLGDFGDRRFMRQLNGVVTHAKGNHDRRNWNRQYVLRYRGKRFLVLHDPNNATTWFDGDWIIHGHTHINTPFVDIGRRRINVSAEMINYAPISMDTIWRIAEESSGYRDDRWFL